LKNKLKEYMKHIDSELGLFIQVDKIIYETFEYKMLDTFYNDKMIMTDNLTDISINIIYLKCFINTEIFTDNKDDIEEILLDEFIHLEICDKLWQIKINEIIYWSIPKCYYIMI